MQPRSRSPYADALGKKPPERFAEYFDFATFPDKAAMKVTRLELFAMLEQHFRALEGRVWYRRLWRWIVAPRGTRRQPVTKPTQGEIERGER